MALRADGYYVGISRSTPELMSFEREGLYVSSSMLTLEEAITHMYQGQSMLKPKRRGQHAFICKQIDGKETTLHMERYELADALGPLGARGPKAWKVEMTRPEVKAAMAKLEAGD